MEVLEGVRLMGHIVGMQMWTQGHYGTLVRDEDQ